VCGRHLWIAIDQEAGGDDLDAMKGYRLAGCMVLSFGAERLGWAGLGWAVLCCAVLCCVGLGLQDNGTMGAHHLATVALVVLSYMLNVHLLGRCPAAAVAVCPVLRLIGSSHRRCTFMSARVTGRQAWACLMGFCCAAHPATCTSSSGNQCSAMHCSMLMQ